MTSTPSGPNRPSSDDDRPVDAAPPFKVRRGRIGDEIERHLCDAILSGRYKHGERLSPNALAQEYDVSAMPVREALVALHKVGLVEMVARRGFRVARLSWRDVEDGFAVQAFITGRLAEYAAAVITPDDVAGLRRLQADIERAAATVGPDTAAHVEELNYTFHRTINMLSDAKQLRQFLRVATGAIPRQLHALIPGWIDATVSEHAQIIDALEAHDGATARRLLEAHVRRAGALVLEKLASGGSWEDEGPTVVPARDERAVEAPGR